MSFGQQYLWSICDMPGLVLQVSTENTKMNMVDKVPAWGLATLTGAQDIYLLAQNCFCDNHGHLCGAQYQSQDVHCVPGTWKSPPSKVKDPMKIDIDAEYHHIICAYVYQKNEVGKPSKRMLWSRTNSLSLARSTFDRTLVKKACQKTLKGVKLDYLDNYLVTGITAWEGLFPEDNQGNVLTSKVTFFTA